ncbi:hypothetical protein F0562_022923 [Nyssa sinensis]|uniref:Uncharacterized protein n=1 Tax=Nyssa sinensis TaxID=561372 RepID=A0A5J5BKT6_9ASTE|nr:hypothetical protein F0562_022923 [Nyssa sinensis]
MLERALSARRAAQFSEEGDNYDKSKTRKHISFAMKATNYLSRTASTTLNLISDLSACHGIETWKNC